MAVLFRSDFTDRIVVDPPLVAAALPSELEESAAAATYLLVKRELVLELDAVSGW